MSLQTTKQFGTPTDMPTLYLKPRGLAVFPVRYAVIPSKPADLSTINLPAHMGDKTKELTLKHHKYALRQLREGYLYVYYHNQAPHKRWDIFKVKDNGSFSELDVKDFKERKENIVLAGLDHFFIDIDIIEQGSKVDFAYSSHPWSRETLALMEQDSSIRNRRMQTFIPKGWASKTAPYYKHGMVLSEENLQHVFEYSGNTDAHAELDPTHLECQMIADEHGQYHEQTLQLNSTNYYADLKHIDTVKKIVENINVAPKQKNQPMILALWDSIGITRELGSFTLDAAGWVAQYQEQFALKCNALENIKLIKTTLQNQAKLANQKIADHLKDKPNNDYQSRQLRAIESQLVKREHGLLQQASHMGYTLAQTKAQANYQKNQQQLEHIRKQIQQREKRQARMRTQIGEKRINDAWSDYADEIDQAAISTFENNYQQLNTAAKALMDARIKDLILWLESPLLANALTELHEDSLIDGLFFEDLVGDLVSCMTACDSGNKKIEQWVKDTALTEDNLYWRAIAGNQSKAKNLLSPVLEQLSASTHTQIDINTILGIPKDLYDRLVDIASLNAASLEAAKKASELGQKIPTGGIDKLYSAMAHRLLSPFIKPGVDTIGSYINRFVHKAKLRMDIKAEAQHYLKRFKEQHAYYEESIKSLNEKIAKAHARANSLSNRHPGTQRLLRFTQMDVERGKNQLLFLLNEKKSTLRNMQLAHGDVIEQLSQESETSIAAHRKIITSPGTALGVFVLAMQTTSIQQLLSQMDAKGADIELSIKLTTAATSITGTIAGLAESFTQTGSAWNTRLKIGGGALIAVTGILSIIMDFRDASKHGQKGNTNLALTYVGKGIISGAGTSFAIGSIATSIHRSWELAFAKRMQFLYARNIIGAGILSRMLFIYSVWASVIIFAIEILIMIYADDELEDWLQQTPFALKPAGKSFEDAETQHKAFEQTIIELFTTDEQKTQNNEPLNYEQHMLNFPM